jgi:signal transduction histidine kinase
VSSGRSGSSWAWLSLWLAVLAAPCAQAAPVVLDDAAAAQQGVSLNGRLEAFYDPDGVLTFEEARSPRQEHRYQPVDGAFNGGFARGGAWWLRFAVSAVDSADPDPDWWLQVVAPYVDYIDIWLPARSETGETTLVHRAIGGKRPVAARDLPWSTSVLKLPPLPTGEPQWVWVRLAGERTLSFTGNVWKLEPMAARLQRITADVAAVIGMMLLMTVVSLLLGAALPDRTFIWYAAYLGSSAVLFACSENLLSALLLPTQPDLAVTIHQLSMCISLIMALLFAHSLLDMPTQFPRLAPVFCGAAWLVGGGVIATLAGHYGVIAPWLNLLRLAFSTVLVVLCIVLIRRGLPAAWPNFVGYSIHGVIGVLHFAKNLNWLPFTWLTQYSYLFGVIVHMLAIFLSLGLRVRDRERQALRDSLVAGARLEARVAERTRELEAEIEERQRAQAQLQRAMHEQRNFLSMVSHEFRTPLSIIGASAEMIADERLSGSPEDAQREAAKISRAKQRMLGLVETLLADEWLESSTMRLNCGDLDLAELLEEKRDEHAHASGRDIRLAFDGTDLTVYADERLLHIVFDNLIENATKYSPPGTAIELHARHEAGEIVVTVRDHGAGFVPSDLDLVFERFYRSAQVIQKPGIGLGLFMVWRIAELHAGVAEAANAEDGGAVITVRLPAAQRARQILQERQEMEAGPSAAAT